MLELRIYGYVQGVGFRYAAKEKAGGLGITGWMQNLGDGTVKARICGSDDAVNTFLDWCKRGPEFAKVERVETSEVSSCDTENFSIRY